VPKWTLGERPLLVNDARDRTSLFDHGWRFSAVDGGGNEMTIRIMQLRECWGQVSMVSARDAITPYLNDAKPPTMLILNREGRFRPLR
jgi:hypothetical protein